MKILIDIGHPAHVHFYARPIELWRNAGHSVIITSRIKEMAADLLDALGVTHNILSKMNDGSKTGMIGELVGRDLALLKVVIREKPDILTGIGGIYVAHAGFLTRTPSITFYDTENATLSNLITYPFTSLVAVPDCYKGWLPPWHLRYPGYHELSYLHPNRFVPDKEKAIAAGLEPSRPTFLLRAVAWKANHDMNEKGWNIGLIKRLVDYLSRRGKVIISSENELPEDLKSFRYRGKHEDVHHLLAYLSLFIGESATMASECAVLGVPAVYAAQTGRGYTDEQEEKYGLVYNVRNFEWKSLHLVLEDIFRQSADSWREKREKLLLEKIDVCKFVEKLVTDFPR